MRGSLPLVSGFFREYRVFGGPYAARPQGTVGLKMAAEIRAFCDISVPTEDFSVPSDADALQGLERAIEDILRGMPVYVGCMGGIGRTGLMLALIAKAWGEQDPVGYVREHYYPHAVETKDQQHFVRNFEIPPRLRWKVRMAKVKDTFRLSGKNLTLGADDLLKKVQKPTKKY
jgi:hypothetical protein